MWSNVRSMSSFRRRPHPRSTARMARSLLPFTVFVFGSCHRDRASSTVSQFPSLMPSFFTPFTRRSKQFVFEMNPVAGDHCFVKGKPRFGTIPTNEVVDGTPIAALRFRRPETYQHCRLDVLQIRETQLGLMPIRFSCSWFSSHGYTSRRGKLGMAGFAI